MVEFSAKVLLIENIFCTRIFSMCIHSTVVHLTKRLSPFFHALNQLHTHARADSSEACSFKDKIKRLNVSLSENFVI